MRKERKIFRFVPHAKVLRMETLNRMQSKQNINKHNVKIADGTLTDYSFLSRYQYTDDIEFVTQFPCLLGHPVLKLISK